MQEFWVFLFPKKRASQGLTVYKCKGNNLKKTGPYAINCMEIVYLVEKLLVIHMYWQREITLRDSLQKFITLHKARSVYPWGLCRKLVEIELMPQGWPHGVPSMPKNLKKVQICHNLFITLLEVNSLTLHNLHYIVLALYKAARPAQIKEKIEILVL